MQLTVRDVSKLLNVSERTVYRWIEKKMIPAYRIHDQYRFNRSEIAEWVAANKIIASPDIFSEQHDTAEQMPGLAKVLRAGGIHYRVEGKDKKTLLRSAVNLMQLPDDVDKQILLDAILSREELGSTGIGEGVAIPHARYPIVTHISESIVSLCFLENAIDFGALDGKPVYCLFTLISPTIRSHLKMLSWIAFVLKDPAVKKAVVTQQSREIIFKEIERVEKTLN